MPGLYHSALLLGDERAMGFREVQEPFGAIPGGLHATWAAVGRARGGIERCNVCGASCILMLWKHIHMCTLLYSSCGTTDSLSRNGALHKANELVTPR
jgi:hypothetical protein